MREHSKENIRLGKIVFYACVAISMLAVTFCRGQLTNNVVLSREKQGFNWITQGYLLEYKSGDSLIISTFNHPYPFDFKGIVIETTGKDKTVQDAVLTIYFENGTSIFVGARPGTYNHGASWFDLNDEEIIKLKTLKVKSLEFFNRHTGNIKVVNNWDWQYFLVASKK